MAKRITRSFLLFPASKLRPLTLWPGWNIVNPSMRHISVYLIFEETFTGDAPLGASPVLSFCISDYSRMIVIATGVAFSSPSTPV